MYLFISAVARDPPAFSLTHDCHIGALRERQIGSMPSAAAFLAIAALAVVLEDRFAGRFIADRATGAATGIGFGHDYSFWK